MSGGQSFFAHVRSLAGRLRWLIVPEPIEPRVFRRYLIVIALIAAGVYYAQRELVVALTPSVDHRYFWRTESTPQKGDYATFILIHPLLDNRPIRVTKRVMCGQGDELRVDGREFYCNGDFLGIAKTEGFLGQKLPLFSFDGVIPSGKAFVAGTHVDSFDSRYWGFIDVADTERVVPVFRGN